MSYYLTDPYYYLPKSYPFLHEKTPYPTRVCSSRATSVGRHLESESAIRRLDLATSSFRDYGHCQTALLRAKYLDQGEQCAELLADVVAHRRNKDANLRRTAHQLASVVKNRQMIAQITQASSHANPI